MLNYLKEEANCTFTENGAVTNITTMSDCLDLFATIGAIRHQSDEEIEKRFIRAFAEDRDIAMKLLFFARDIRQGLGERRVFKVILNYLARNEQKTVCKNLAYVAEYGRFDDLLALMDTPCEKNMLDVLKAQFDKDSEALKFGGEVSLLAKWLPSVNATNSTTVLYAKKVAKHFGLSQRAYRKALVALRAHISIIENNLRERDYTFDYSKQPSKALYKYRKAFMRNDGERYEKYIDDVTSGKAKLNTSTLAPYELVEPYLRASWYNISDFEKKSLNATWASLPSYETEENMLAVIDTSGSMYCNVTPMPAAVALSLGLYFAEHNSGHFKNHFITFSTRPRLVEIKGETFVDKLHYVTSMSEVADTNIEAVFNLVLSAAVKNKVPQNELPTKIVIVSDMEFNRCATNASISNFENAKRSYESYGYKLPQIVFWNVNSRNTQQPVTKNEQGVALVSGCTPKLFSMIEGGIVDPYLFMMEVIGSERYSIISA